ncbi:UDP-glycosyltransferase 88B1-like [Lolium rigidum]|uniref:UDP-glycosyltransferase 88B1-like n=1 Tax=Lolium rigidum TaxID=89674 RepID=UPI001F5DB633|nr:UDP-glycosyltransferase 88B1-like [Lolium rigidum]XP_051215740.1 UDP-glycosyltransferase 88B1-like [Lolium perenne]
MPSANVLLLPEPGSGHLMSLIEAGKRLIGHGGSDALTVTVLIIRPATAESAAEVDAHVSRVAASGSGIRFHRLPAVDPPTDCAGNLQEFKSRYMQLQAPHVKAALADLDAAALVIDFFATAVIDAARELAVPTYVYFTSTAALLALTLRLPVLDEVVQAFDGAVDVPGMPPVPAGSVPGFLGDKKSPNYAWFVYHGRRFMDADGIIINTVGELEPGLLAAIAQGRCVPGRRAPPLYPIGPVIDLGVKESSEDCVRWLDAQPRASVVFLCFGSLGFFDVAKAHEVATGLERSGHRFMWTLRGPPVAGSRHPTDADLDELLPEGFLERTKRRGLVWPMRAPQKEILAHPAVGCFVTHCGWNSTLESLWHGVPLVPWPLYAEQHLNAFELVSDVGVAVAMEVDRKGNNFVEAEDLERAVRCLMDGSDEGLKAREKAMKMKAACRKAVEDGGSSYAALQRLRHAILRGTKCNGVASPGETHLATTS